MEIFKRQLFALLWRNFLVKKKRKRQTLAEVLFPIYMVALLVVIQKTSLVTQIYPEIPVPTGNLYLWEKPLFLRVGLVPDNAQVREIRGIMRNASQDSISLSIYNTSEELLKVYEGNETYLDAGVIFTDNPKDNGSYVLKFPFDQVPATTPDTLYAKSADCRNASPVASCPALKYYTSHFSFLQAVVDSALLNLRYGQTAGFVPNSRISIYPKPSTGDTGTVLRIIVPMYLVLGLSPLVANLIVSIVYEKEKKIKEAMSIMGMKQSCYWLSWFLIEAFLILLLTVFTAAIIGLAGILPNTNMFVVFLLIFLYGLSLILLAFMLSPFFDKSKTAGTACGFIVALFSVIHLLAVYLKDSLSAPIFHLLALLSPAACGIGVESIVEMDSAGNGVSTDNLFVGKFSPGSAIIMLVVDIALYGILALYFDLVIPGEFGPRHQPWFFVLPSFWRNKKESSKINHQLDEIPSCDDVEPVPEHMKNKEAIRIRDIRKTFSKCKGVQVKAVDGINLQIYEDQITALLGHNGAGKTTLINMLVGIIPPTYGSAQIYGLDVSDAMDMWKLRCMTGICLQENILIEELTCRDHLMFFAKLKGVPQDKQECQVRELVKELNLVDCQDTISKSLSGGQKRKLCVAIALIGDPKILFLDEPSSGVDPYSRRQMWTLLQKKKEGRVVVLTTHFMDEADILADRKAIVSRGKIRCAGSSFFLKNKFGIGYHVIIELDFARQEETVVTEMVKAHIPDAFLSRSTASELSFVLPLRQTQAFPKLFAAIEESCLARMYGMKGYGVSMTTLEEVFIALGEESSAEEVNQEQHTQRDTEELLIDSSSHGDVAAPPLIRCEPSFRQAFVAFLRARFLLLMRNPRNVAIIIITPLVLVLINYFLLKNSGQGAQDVHPLRLTPTLYPSFEVKIQNETDQRPIFEQLMRYLQEDLDLHSDLVSNMTISNLRPSFMAFIVNHQPWDWLVNDTAIHYLPIVQNVMSNFYKSTLHPSDNNKLEVYSEPFPKKQGSTQGQVVFDGLLYTWTILLSTILGYLPPTIAVEVVEEREAHIKNQLRVSGLSFGMYWLVTTVTHSLLLLVPISVLVIGMLAMNIFDSAMANLAMVLLCLLFIPSSLLYSYVITFCFDRHDTAKKSMPTISFFISFIPMIVIFMIQTFVSQISTVLHIIFCILSPLYCPTGGLFFVVQVNQQLKIKRSFGIPVDDNAYFEAGNKILPTLIIMTLNTFLYFVVLRVLDVAKSGGRIRDAFLWNPSGDHYVANPEPPHDEDVDVKDERQKIDGLVDINPPPALLIKELGKHFMNTTCGMNRSVGKVAVHNLSLVMESGHIFGLLGPNGAGKSSTMKMIISEENPTYGKICVSGHNITSNLSEAFRMIGYCPQHDALWGKLTVTEHIRLYAAIRGVCPQEIDSLCNKMLGGLNIEEHADKQAKELSGGTKRKLSYILSMMGTPELVLLDEPSTGMDPQAKRFLWDTICTAFPAHGKRTVLLTTHSMEEADILCTRIGIMVNGLLKCLGSSQYLKNKYGSGYTLDVKIREAKQMQKLIESAKDIFPSAQQKEAFENRITFLIPKTSVPSIARAFDAMERASSKLGIEEYSFSQTSLEQVFLEFAKQQEE